MAFEDDADLGDAREVGDVDFRHKRAAVGHAAHQVLPGQPLQGLPDRGATNLELVTEPTFLDHRAGRHVEADDAVSNPKVGFFALRSRRVRDSAQRMPSSNRPSLRCQPL